LGPLAIPSYGVVAVLAFLACFAMLKPWSLREGLDPRKMRDFVALAAMVALVGSRVVSLIVDGEQMLADPLLLFYSAGHFLGGVVAAIVFGVVWLRYIKVPYLQGLDVLVLNGALVTGIARWGCFLSGCCYGKPTGLPWGVHFPPLAQHLHEGLPDVPVHPTQIYFSINGFVILALLCWAYRHKRFHGQIAMLYLMLQPATRFFLEYLRGDADRGFWFGGLLSTSQVMGVCIALAAGTALAALAWHHRRSEAPDWQPAPLPRSARRGAERPAAGRKSRPGRAAAR
jgi:phosphatidylglycerol:prolipoprotein diacylglycerol transferase